MKLSPKEQQLRALREARYVNAIEPPPRPIKVTDEYVTNVTAYDTYAATYEPGDSVLNIAAKLGRPQIHADRAAKQKAYRERRKAK